MTNQQEEYLLTYSNKDKSWLFYATSLEQIELVDYGESDSQEDVVHMPVKEYGLTRMTNGEFKTKDVLSWRYIRA